MPEGDWWHQSHPWRAVICHARCRCLGMYRSRALQAIFPSLYQSMKLLLHVKQWKEPEVWRTPWIFLTDKSNMNFRHASAVGSICSTSYQLVMTCAQRYQRCIVRPACSRPLLSWQVKCSDRSQLKQSNLSHVSPLPSFAVLLLLLRVQYVLDRESDSCRPRPEMPARDQRLEEYIHGF